MAKKRKKKPYGKYSAGEYKENLETLETFFGSQKKAAAALGISTATYKRQKSGQSIPSDPSKANRIMGNAANKKKMTTPEFKEKVEKKRETKAKKELAKSLKVKMESTRSWVADTLGEIRREIALQILNISPYVRYNGEEKVNVQFSDGFDPEGKPSGTKRAKAWAIYTPFGYVSGEMTIEIGIDSLLIGSAIGLLDDIKSEWSITKTNDYIQSKFGNPSKKKGKQKYIMSRYLGYQLY